MEGTIKQVLVNCRQCRKEIKTEAYRCMACMKDFHPSCHRQHRVYNSANELVPCTGKVEIFAVKGRNINESRRLSVTDEEQASGSSMDSKIDGIYKLLIEMREEVISRECIKQMITEVISEEMDKIRMEIQKWKIAEIETLINQAVTREVKNINSLSTILTEQDETSRNTYSQAVKNKSGSVLIIKPKDDDDKNSEVTKREIKNKIDVAKLGIGITKMRKVTRGAVVVGCEDKKQAKKLKEEVAKDLGEKYLVQEPRKRKLKVKIHGVDEEDCDNENDFWNKIEEQNGYEKDAVKGKIVHKAAGPKSRGVTIIAEMGVDAREKLLEAGKVKIGWRMCRVQDYLGILRCYKCCGFYHFAKDCKNKEVCGLCAGQHMTKECKNRERKCVNCEDKIKNMKIKNLKSDHSAYDNKCPCFVREIEKYKSRIQGSI